MGDGMSDGTRATGDAAWRADRDAIADRNAAVRKRAQEKKTPAQLALEGRNARGAVIEAAQLRELNERLAKGH